MLLNRKGTLTGFALSFLVAAFPALAQKPQPVTNPAISDIPVFRVTVVARTIQAVNFHHRQGSTDMALTGTSLAPQAKGTVRADSKTGATKLEISVDKLPKPWTINDSMLTYVVWAITPEGRPEVVGELALNGDDARLSASSELQSFGLIVTAEPYFAVTQPSDIVVMEGTVTKDTTGTIQFVDAKYELLPRDAYVNYLPAATRARLKSNREAPLDLLQARHAVAIADSFGAERYAADTMSKALVDLKNAEDYYSNKGDKKKIETLSRNATQLSEDARLISVSKRQADELAQERQTAQTNLSDAKTAAERETRQRELAQTEARIASERAANEATQRQLAEARQAAAQAESQRAQSELSRVQTETAVARATADQARLQAEADRGKAEQLLADARISQQALSSQADEARRRAEQAEADRAKTRIELMRQLNIVLATKETARGLVVNMSGVLFDTNQATLKPGAREKLAKIAGILATHPDLKLEVEGHTDSVGSDQLNQTLSEKRAASVRDYLVMDGVNLNSVTSVGKGKQFPVATNNTAAGRQQNRRVEIIVSGDSVRSASN